MCLSVSWKASLMQWSSHAERATTMMRHHVSPAVSDSQIEINRLNAKTVFKIKIDMNSKLQKLLWFPDLYMTCLTSGHKTVVPKTIVRDALFQWAEMKIILTTVNHLETVSVTASGIDRSVIFWLSGVAVESGSGRWRGKSTAARSARNRWHNDSLWFEIHIVTFNRIDH